MGSWRGEGGGRYHRVLQQVLQFAQSAALVTCVLSLDGFLELAQVRLAVPSVTHKLTKDTEIKNMTVILTETCCCCCFLVKLKVNVEDVLRELKIQWASCVCGPEAWGYEAAQYIYLRQRGRVQKRILLKGHYVGLKSKFESWFVASPGSMPCCLWDAAPHTHRAGSPTATESAGLRCMPDNMQRTCLSHWSYKPPMVATGH